MPNTRTLTVTLPADQVDMIEAMVEVGEIPSADAFVSQAIRFDVVDPHLKRDLATAIAQADAGDGVDAFEFLDELKQRALARLKDDTPTP